MRKIFPLLSFLLTLLSLWAAFNRWLNQESYSKYFPNRR